MTLKSMAENPELYLATAAEMLTAEGMTEAAEILRVSMARVEETGYDNWNGGTTIWTIYLLVEPSAYAELGSKREILEDQINKRLKPILEQFTSDWFGVSIAPKVTPRPEWRHAKGDVSRATRQNIIDGLKIDQIAWSGRLEDVEFLQRLYDLESLPSYDSRFKNAAGDIWQHRVNNPTDWADDWIYDDARFNLLQGTTEAFLRFLCEMIHPVVRPDRNEALMLVQHFNDQLRLEGWNLAEEEMIAGRPRFVAKRLQVSGGRSVSRARTVADALDAGWMQKEIERVENAVERDPALAIGTAKELVETCCKSILSKRGVEVSRKADLPELTKLLAKELSLVPEGISEQAKGAETIRLILRNLSSLTQYLAELRGLYGSGHGRDGRYRGLEPRHARLAVGAAVAFIDFVTETHHQRGLSK
jgi:AbiJ N-terminal domain 3/Abortive infection C-terminus